MAARRSRLQWLVLNVTLTTFIALATRHLSTCDAFVVGEGVEQVDVAEPEPEVETTDYRTTTGRQILVFGGNGFLGANTVEKLIKLGDNVTIVNRGNWYWDSKARIGSFVKSISCDRKNGVASCDELVQFINSVDQFDAVIDFSAFSGRETRESTSLLRGKVSLYVHISTDSVYDVCDTTKEVQDSPPGPLRESDAVRPTDTYLRDMLSSHHDYGHRKMQAEEALVEQRNNVSDDGMFTRGIPYVIFRLPDVLGPRDTTYRFWIYQLWVRMAPLLQSRPVTIPHFLVDYNNSFVYVDDVSQAILSVIDRSTTDPDSVTGLHSFIDEAFNVAWPENITLERLLRDIEAALGLPPELVPQKFQKDEESANLYLYPTVRRGPISVDKAVKVLDWKPTPWRAAINATVQFYEVAMTDPRWSVQRDEIIQIQISQLYSDMKEEFLEALEKVYHIDLGHFKPRRDEL